MSLPNSYNPGVVPPQRPRSAARTAQLLLTLIDQRVSKATGLQPAQVMVSCDGTIGANFGDGADCATGTPTGPRVLASRPLVGPLAGVPIVPQLRGSSPALSGTSGGASGGGGTPLVVVFTSPPRIPVLTAALDGLDAHVEWTNVGTGVLYSLARVVDGVTASTVYTGTAVTFVDPGLGAGAYCYTVTATSAGGSSVSNTACVTLALPGPSTLSGVAVG